MVFGLAGFDLDPQRAELRGLRPADAGGRQLDDGVGRLDDLRILDQFETDVAGAVHDCC